MATSNWGFSYSIVAGADLSDQQYKNVNVSGVLAATDMTVFGVLQNKPRAGEHAAVKTIGVSKVYCPVSIGPNTLIGQSNVTSGVIAIVTSGGVAFGRTLTSGTSGSYVTALLFGCPIYVAK